MVATATKDICHTDATITMDSRLVMKLIWLIKDNWRILHKSFIPVECVSDIDIAPHVGGEVLFTQRRSMCLSSLRGANTI